MSGYVGRTNADDEEYEDDGDPDARADCFHCGGDGYNECNDPLGCSYAHTRDGLCPCASCGGSGLAKDMTIW